MNTSSSASSLGGCPKPFLFEGNFPTVGGFVSGRFCAPIPSSGASISCCLPCPHEDWFYPDSYKELTHIPDYINAVSVAAACFILLSFAFLPAEKTRRSYLTINLVVATILPSLGFIIPWGVKPNQCFNEITPNDMNSDITCAFSGALLISGSWAVVSWIFLRSLVLHLQICWHTVCGNRFMYSAIIGGWCIPGVALTIALAITGVSYRFGNTCHINHDHNIEFWAPVLTVAGATTIIQFTTLAYCVKVYLRSLLDDGIASTNNSAGPPSLASKTLTPRQAYRRMRKIIELQWRGILIVLVFIADVVLFSVVFLYMDNTTQVTENLTKAKPWLVCIVIAGGDKNQCLEPAKKLVVNQATLLAVLILLSINGLWTLVFFFRWSMITCWIELFKEKFSHKREFVSLDAHRYSAEPRTYEMIGKASSSYNISSPTVPEQAPVYSPAGRTSNSYFDSTPTEATWSATKSPLSPSQIDEKDWDPRNTYARGTMWPGSKMI